MVYPTKKDIEDVVEYLRIQVDECSAYDVPMAAKRVGELIAMAESEKIISTHEGNIFHKRSNESIRKFEETCYCIHRIKNQVIYL